MPTPAFRPRPASAAIRPVFLVALCLAVCFAADPAFARSSIGIGTSDPVTAPGNGIFSALFIEIAARQREFFSALREALIGLKRGEGALVFLAGLSFAYGIFHAAGPGHGKAVISSYMLASRAQLRRGIALAFASSLLQAVSAILVVGAGWYLLRGTGISMTDATDWLEIASYAMVTLFGFYLLARAAAKLGRRWRLTERMSRLRSGVFAPRPSAAGGTLAFAAPAETRAPTMRAAEALPVGVVCTETADDCACGRAHIASPERLREPLTLKTAAALIASVGLRPCAGAIVVLTFALLNQLYLGGLVSVLAMSLGTAITVSALATLAVATRGAIERAGRHARRAALVGLGLEIVGALLLTVVGIGLLGGALTTL
ncbi:delayed-early response protein/equilibrative nucleoside transporter [Jiella sp. 40Bstr34]|uniref:Nickel/cobalt efflux system n=2 Tax=Jiella pacifica TaxID=2696469 RepID=A0A6N9T9F3_9HYPH|nr:delayed-early response protein/equilibrative nucleoside transporter [Jiella pacifica]